MKYENIEKVIINRLNQLASETSLEDYDEFVQQLIEKYSIDYKTCDGFYKIIQLSQGAVFIDYFADIQFLILKNYLMNKYSRELSDEEVKERVLRTPNLFINKYFSYPVVDMRVKDRLTIYNKMNVLTDLYRVDYFNEIENDILKKIMEKFTDYDFTNVSNKHNTLDNIKQKESLLQLGLREFSEKEVKRVLNR